MALSRPVVVMSPAPEGRWFVKVLRGGSVVNQTAALDIVTAERAKRELTREPWSNTWTVRQ